VFPDRERRSISIYHLPRIDHTPVENIPEIATQRGDEHLLFAGNEVALAYWGKQTLEPLGHDVVACTSAVEPLNLLRAAPQEFAVLVTDDTMPGMTGEGLVREASAFAPLSPSSCEPTAVPP
jgi:two-component system cell cycle sensor histidine kinase/response regulator CckA